MEADISVLFRTLFSLRWIPIEKEGEIPLLFYIKNLLDFA